MVKVSRGRPGVAAAAMAAGNPTLLPVDPDQTESEDDATWATRAPAPAVPCEEEEGGKGGVSDLSPITPQTSPRTPHPSPLTPHRFFLTPQPSSFTPHPSTLTP